MIEASLRYKKAVVIGGGLLGLEAANGLMRRGMDVTVVHVMPWLMERQLDDVAGKLLQKSLEDRGLKFMLGAHTQELVAGESGRVQKVIVQGRHRRRRRPGGDGRGHPPQHRAGRKDEAARQPRHRRARHHADRDRCAHLLGGRVRRPPRHRLRPGGAAVRAGQGGGQPPGAVRHRTLHRLAHLHQAQGHRHRPVLVRRLHGRAGHGRRRGRHGRNRDVRSLRRRLQETGDPGRQAGRRLPVRRHGGRQLVLQAAARGPQRGRHPRQADVRRIQPGRCRPRRPHQGRVHAR